MLVEGRIQVIVSFDLCIYAEPRAPQDIQAIVMNNSRVRVTWNLLSDEEAQGAVLSYIVTYSNGIETRNITVPSNQNFVVLSDLTPGTDYTVRVSARTSAGVGALTTTKVTVQVDSTGQCTFSLLTTKVKRILWRWDVHICA